MLWVNEVHFSFSVSQLPITIKTIEDGFQNGQTGPQTWSLLLSEAVCIPLKNSTEKPHLGGKQPGALGQNMSLHSLNQV